MADLFRFRCPACGKLLGAPARKVGRPIRCPRCGAEQVVPRPADEPDDDDEPADDAAEDAVDLGELGIDLGLNLGPAPALRPAEAPRSARPSEGPDVGRLVAEFLAAPDEPEADPATDPDDEGPSGEPIVRAPAGPLVSGPRRRGRRDAAGPRPGRDVVLPRTAAVAWSLFALLALGLSFVAGLLVGHYRWR